MGHIAPRLRICEEYLHSLYLMTLCVDTAKAPLFFFTYFTHTKSVYRFFIGARGSSIFWTYLRVNNEYCMVCFLCL